MSSVCTVIIVVMTVFVGQAFSAPDSRKIDECTCFEKGNYYTTEVSNGCRTFLQRTAYLTAVRHNCAPGLIFDPNACVCDYAWRAICPRQCEKETVVTPVADQCEEKGNIYGPVPGSSCTKFTQATEYLAPQEHSCPPGLRFNTKECVCDWPNKFQCTV